LGHSPRIIC